MRKIGTKASAVTLKDFGGRMKDVDLDTYFIFGAIILVMLLGAYALFSPEGANPKMGNPACGKIVIASDGASLRSNVAGTLQDAPYFLVVDPLKGKLLEAVKNPYRGPQPDPKIAYLIAGKGEEAVIVGNIDQQSYNILMQFGIRVFGGYTGKSQRVIKLYRQARIVQTPALNTVPQPSMNAPGAPLNTQGISANPQGMAVGFGQGPFVQGQGVPANYFCPQCRYAMNGQNFGGNVPVCPHCRNLMMQQNAGQGAAWGMPDTNGMGFDNGLQVTPNAVQAGGGMQNGTGPTCPLPMRQNAFVQGAMIQGVAMPDADTMRQANPFTQIAFNWGEQPFVCPNCNWRLKATRQGNSYPGCPNCGSSMALDKSNQGWWPQGGQQGVQQAANMAQLQVGQQVANMGQFQGGQPVRTWRSYSRNSIKP